MMVSIGMVAEHVKAQVTQVDCDAGWDCCKTNPAACNNDMATTPHISQVECSNCAGNSDCNNGNTCSSIGQGGFSPVSFQPDNCFWSYPVLYPTICSIFEKTYRPG